MRIDEIASAEEQMALWRLINDNVWQAIETQRQQQAQVAQAKAAKAKLKPRKGGKAGRGKLSIPMPPPPPSPKVPPAKKPEASANPQQAKPQNLQYPDQARQQAAQQKTAPIQTVAAPIAPVNVSKPQKGVPFVQKLVAKNLPPRGDDRHCKNGYPLNPMHKVKPVGAIPRAQ
jgi:hypothetical protein